MRLSNTATPRYYGEFKEAVMSGRIPVCNEISLEMNRIDRLIEDPKYYYCPDKVEGYIRYCENELTLTDGSNLKLLLSFKLWAEQVLGWYIYVENERYQPYRDRPGGDIIKTRKLERLTKKQYLIVARGAAKSMYAMTMHAYFLNVDLSTTHQITTAPTMKQAEEVLSPFRTSIIRSKGPLFRFLTEGSLQNTTGSRALRQKLSSTKKGIENFQTGSLLEIRPMTIDKLQGLRSVVATIDEWLSGDIREDVVGAVEQGASKNPNYIIIALSSEGTVRNSVGDTIKMELAEILKGQFDAPHISIWHYKLDEVEEVADPSLYPKANPNIGMTVQYETYLRDKERAEKIPAARNDILAKRFGIPMEGHTFFFTYEETQPHPRADFWKLPCALGADLSQGDDFCAFTFLFPLPREKFGIKTRSYISELTFDRLQPAMRKKYEEFLDEKSLVVMPGKILDILSVYDDLEAFAEEHAYDIRAFGYDPYNAREFVERYILLNGEHAVEKVIQGFRSESVPLGEIKKLAQERELIFDQKLMEFAMGNSAVMQDVKGNRKLLKRRIDEKIDNVSALNNGYIAYKLFKESFE